MADHAGQRDGSGCVVDGRGLITSLVDLAGRPRGDPGRARPGTCCRCTGTSPTSGTPGTSTSTTGAPCVDLDDARVGQRLGRTAGPGGRAGRPSVRRLDDRAADQPCPRRAGRRRSPPASTGTNGRSCSSSRSRSMSQADRSASETQFGHVFRPTHTNTSWEAAEVRDLRAPLDPRCRAGFRRRDRQRSDLRPRRHLDAGRGTGGAGRSPTVRLSLLRAPLYPDPDADQGHARLPTSLVPGADIADAPSGRATRLNLPLRTVPGSREVAPIVTVSNPAVVVEAVKLAEDRSGDVIVRLYESLGDGSTATVTRRVRRVERARCTDLLERPVRAGTSPPTRPAASRAPPVESVDPASALRV